MTVPSHEGAMSPAPKGVRSWDSRQAQSDWIPEWIEQEARAVGLTTNTASVFELRDTYIDTADNDLMQRGLALRIRRWGELLEATMFETSDPRSRDGNGVLNGARELTEPLGADRPDLVSKLMGPLGRRVRELIGDGALVEQYTLRIKRSVMTICEPSEIAAMVPLADAEIEQVWAESTDDSVAVRLTLLPDREDGRIERFVSAADCAPPLQRSSGPLHDLVMGKLGLAAATPAWLPDGDLQIEPHHTMAQAALAVLRKQCRKMLENESGTRIGHDPEYLHDMRVATRRMRAAIKLFRVGLSDEALALNKELAWLGRTLGEVRDLDVQLEHLDEVVESAAASDDDESARGLAGLRRVLDERRDLARDRMTEALDGDRYRELVKSLQGLVSGDRIESAPAAGGAPILVMAPLLIEKRQRQIDRHMRRMEHPPSFDDLHDLRILCKALRYAIEFHAPLYGDRARHVIKRTVHVQDALGDMQDARVALDWMRDIVEDESAELSPHTVFTIGRLTERRAASVDRLIDDARKKVDALGGPAWRKLRRKMRHRALDWSKYASRS